MAGWLLKRIRDVADRSVLCYLLTIVAVSGLGRIVLAIWNGHGLFDAVGITFFSFIVVFIIWLIYNAIFVRRSSRW
jgi:biotin transporter BioY